jgi:CBS domain containing-hemolysin-like protein
MAVILIINTLAHTIGASVSGSQFATLFGNRWIWAYSLVFSFVMIEWCEILPKSMAVRYNHFFAKLTAIPLRATVALFSPILRFMEWLNRPFEPSDATDKVPDALSDISVLAHFATYHKMLTPEQEAIVERSISLSQKSVKDIMVERASIKYLSSKMTMVEALIEAHIHHHTRYLLIRDDNLDDVVGYVNMKDIVSALQINPQNPSLEGIARPIAVVAPHMKVSELLRQLTKGCQHIALVKDSDNKICGIVTLEDVIEAIVGEIEDEYDILPVHIVKLSDLRVIAGGGVTLKDLKEQTGFEIPDVSVTLHDWITENIEGKFTAEKKMKLGETIVIIRKIRRSRVHEVIIERAEAIK